MKELHWKEWVNFIFLAVGIIAVIMLPITVNTYLDYSENGLGVEVELVEVLDGTNELVIMRFNLTNPGQLDMLIINSTITVTNGDLVYYDGLALQDSLPRMETTFVNKNFYIGPGGYEIATHPDSQIIVEFTIFVETKDALTKVVFTATGGDL